MDRNGCHELVACSSRHHNDLSSIGLRGPYPAAETAVSVCDYMYEDGVMAEGKFRKLVEDLVLEFEAGKGVSSRKTR
jgi:hypothetical protein